MKDLDRRGAMRTLGAGAVAAFALGGAADALAKAPADPAAGLRKRRGGAGAHPQKYALPELPFEKDALMPLINEKTAMLHHDKHHAGYVRKANAAIDKLIKARASGDLSSVKSLSRDLAFNASGVVLHDLYWESIAPASAPSDPEKDVDRDLLDAIELNFGSFNNMVAHFAAATKSVEASGWGVLAYEPVSNRLLVLTVEKHQNLSVIGTLPLMCCDVWEHAYYLTWQNDRGGYVDTFCKMVNWKTANARYRMFKHVYMG